MSSPRRSRQRQTVPGWISEGTAIHDPHAGRRGVVQFIGEWTNPNTGLVVENAVYARVAGGGPEWVVSDPSSLERD
ncbi:hypothetical protein ACWGE1_09410 [Streptomyces sp. NPDC054932]